MQTFRVRKTICLQAFVEVWECTYLGGSIRRCIRFSVCEVVPSQIILNNGAKFYRTFVHKKWLPKSYPKASCVQKAPQWGRCILSIAQASKQVSEWVYLVWAACVCILICIEWISTLRECVKCGLWCWLRSAKHFNIHISTPISPVRG